MVVCCVMLYSVVVVCSAICVRVSSGLGKTVRDRVTLGLPNYVSLSASDSTADIFQWVTLWVVTEVVQCVVVCESS